MPAGSSQITRIVLDYSNICLHTTNRAGSWLQRTSSSKGARQHNLKDIDLTIPRDELIVFTGLSGSGKSSLAFDTIYAEGQRRYVESLSSYARQFLGQMEKPDIDSIDGLSPAVSIDQKTTSKNPRSTVGTTTEIYDYLRLLYARIGMPHCPICGRVIEKQTADQIADRIMAHSEPGDRIIVMAPVVRGRKGEFAKFFEDLVKEGFSRVRIDGEMHRLDEGLKLDKKYKHDIEVVIDRIVLKDSALPRLVEAIETATTLTKGTVLIKVLPRTTRAKGASSTPRVRWPRPVSRASTSSTWRSPAPSTTTRSTSSTRATSASTPPMAPAPTAWAWARVRKSTRTSSFPTRTSRSKRARSRCSAPRATTIRRCTPPCASTWAAT